MFPPPNSCDCHVHVIGAKGRFPLPANRRYTPSDATAAELAAMLKRLGMTRVVIVQPSFYGTDNACTLDGIAQLGNARGVAVIAPDTPEKELDILHDQGIRGLRINIATMGGEPVDAIKAKITAAAKLCGSTAGTCRCSSTRTPWSRWRRCSSRYQLTACSTISASLRRARRMARCARCKSCSKQARPG